MGAVKDLLDYGKDKKVSLSLVGTCILAAVGYGVIEIPAYTKEETHTADMATMSAAIQQEKMRNDKQEITILIKYINTLKLTKAQLDAVDKPIPDFIDVDIATSIARLKELGVEIKG